MASCSSSTALGGVVAEISLGPRPVAYPASLRRLRGPVGFFLTFFSAMGGCLAYSTLLFQAADARHQHCYRKRHAADHDTADGDGDRRAGEFCDRSRYQTANRHKFPGKSVNAHHPTAQLIG